MIFTKISVCVDALFGGKNFTQSLGQLKEAGVETFEFWSWWDKDLAALKKAKDELGLTLTTFCTRMVSLVDPSKREEYLGGLTESIAVANQLDCRSLITQVGSDTGRARDYQMKSLVEGLKAGAPLLEKAGITLLVEPLNTQVDHAGYFLSSSREGFDMIDAVASPNVKLLFDIYHQQITEGDVLRSITGHIDQIGHFHAAGSAGRHELCYGELNYRYLFDAIKKTGYSGCMGLEYFPLDEPLKGIKAWL